MLIAKIGFEQSSGRSAVSLFLFELQLAFRFVLLEKCPQIAGGIEQARPLFVIECNREASQAIYTDAPFFPDSEFELPTAPAPFLLLQFRDARLEFLVRWFRHLPLPQ